MYIFCGPGLASHRRCQLSSNVRQRKALHPLLLLRTQDTVAIEHRRFCRARRGVGAKAPSLSYGLASWLLGQQRKLQGGRSAKSNQRTALELCCSASLWGRRVKHRRARPCQGRVAAWVRGMPQLSARSGRHMQRASKRCKALAGPTVTTASGATLPNPSVKPSPNGGPPGPGHMYHVHSLWPGPGVPPLVPAYLER